MGEFEWIDRIAGLLPRPASPDVGIGSDCAVVHARDPGTRLALKVDAVVEGVHFDRSLLSLEDVAARGVEAAMSDLAAAGASIRYEPGSGCGLLWALTLAAGTRDADIDALARGCARAAERAGAVVFGGNISRGPVLSLTTTAIGRIHGPAPTRTGARPGDALYVTGPVGAAGLGLRCLKLGLASEPATQPFVRAWRAPRARLDVGEHVARIAHATVDISDGLAADVGHIAHASHCAVTIDARRLPLLEGHANLARRVNEDPFAIALGGGEDYEICFAAEVEPAEELACTRIGEFVAGSGVYIRTDDEIRAWTGRGWDHFREP